MRLMEIGVVADATAVSRVSESRCHTVSMFKLLVLYCSSTSTSLNSPSNSPILSLIPENSEHFAKYAPQPLAISERFDPTYPTGYLSLNQR